MHHIATILGKKWGKDLARLFRSAGLDPRDAANLLVLVGHSGRHTNEYHEWVFRVLEAAVGAKTGQAAKEALLERLAWIRQKLLDDVNLPYAKGGFPQ